MAGDPQLVGFYGAYKDVFDAVKTAIEKKSSIKSVLLGEQFSYNSLPKAVVNALPSGTYATATVHSADQLRERRISFCNCQDS
jgi:hypothetical protein